MIRKLRNAFSCGILLTACLLSLSVEIFSQPVWNTGSSNQQNASGTGTSYSITRPTNIVAGDLVILILTQQRSSPTANTSSFVPNAANGFTLIAASNDANNDRTSIAAYFKIAGASEPVSYTGTVTQFASVTPSWKASVTRVTGHNRSNPIGPNNVANAFNTSNISIPQISINSGNSLLVASRSVRVQTGALNTVPTGMTQNLFSNGTGTVDASTNAPSFQVATQLLASGGNTGVKQFTWTATSSEVYAAGLMFSINPLIIPVTGISTNFGGYWATNIATNNPIEPNNSHELLSFTYNGTQFSTGVNDATLTANGVPFTPGNYRGVPFVGLPGSLSSNTSNTLLAMASLKDGNPLQGVATHPNINGKTIRDVLTDGIRGLDLGTGVTNLPSSAVISFSISSIREDAIADDFPDLLVTQIAQPGGTTDIYGFYDAAGVLIGNLVSQVQSSLLQLGIYRLDLFSLTAESLNNATPWGGLFEPANGTRPIRFSAYKISDFGINAGNYQQIAEFRIVPSGNSDLAFLGYNANSINFRPAVSIDPSNSVSNVCSDGTAILKVIASPANEGVLSYQWQEKVGANPFVNISDVGAYSGTGTEELRVDNPTAGVQYRCIVTETSTFLGDVSNTSEIFTISITNIGNPSIATQPANVAGCAGTPFNIFVIPSGGTGVYKYQWQSGTSTTGPWTDISGATESNLVGTIANPGPSFFRVLVSNDGCDGSVNSAAATITTTAAGTVLTTSDAQRCGTGTVTFTASSSAGGTISWNNSLGTQVASGPTFTTPSLSVSTNYFVTATVSTCTTPSQTVTANIYPGFRTSRSGIWKESEGNPATSIWEVEAGSGLWQASTSAPAKGVPVSILHEVSLNVDFTIENCPLTLENNGTSRLIIEPGMTLGFNGGTDGNAYFNNRPVVLKSTTLGTGAIGTMWANSKTLGDENVTVERFIPGPADPANPGGRRWNLLTFGVINGSTINTNSTIRDAWGGGLRSRVANSTNRMNFLPPLPFGTPSPAYLASHWTLPDTLKPNNSPWHTETNGLPADYVPGDGTIITGHRYQTATAANADGYDWWPELNIPVDSAFWIYDPNKPKDRQYRTAFARNNPITTPASIRPYRPEAFNDFGPNRGKGFVSNNAINGKDINGNDSATSLINTPLSAADQGYMLYTRGDRSVLENWNGETTLRPTGKIRTENVFIPIKAKATHPLTLIGNPYPAPLDFGKVLDTAVNNNLIEPRFHFWDSRLPGNFNHGAWRTAFRISNNWYVTIPSELPPVIPPSDPSDGSADNNARNISSSQAVFVEAKDGAGNLVITERMKASPNEVSIRPFSEPEPASEQLLFININLQEGSGAAPLDGVAIILDNKATPEVTDGNDILKLFKFSGNHNLSLLRNDSRMVVEAFPEPDQETVFPLEVTGLSSGRYFFSFHVKNLYKDGREIFIRDKFLSTLTPINAITPSKYTFDADEMNTSSINPDRFEIVFRNSGILPLNFITLRAAQIQDNVRLTWSMANEENLSHYEVEHSRNSTVFSKGIKVALKNNNTTDYEWWHIQPEEGFHFYRIRAVDNNGNDLLSRVVKVNIGPEKPEFKVYPTIVNASSDITLEMTSLKKGNYTIQISDMSGKVIVTQTINHAGGSAAQMVRLPSALALGRYNVSLMGENNEKYLDVILKN